jgi:hypothetical protein
MSFEWKMKERKLLLKISKLNRTAVQAGACFSEPKGGTSVCLSVKTKTMGFGGNIGCTVDTRTSTRRIKN